VVLPISLLAAQARAAIAAILFPNDQSVLHFTRTTDNGSLRSAASAAPACAALPFFEIATSEIGEACMWAGELYETGTEQGFGGRVVLLAGSSRADKFESVTNGALCT
jgi:hypothetical protein